MSQLIPPTDRTPPSVKQLPAAERVQLWIDQVKMSEAFVLGGLRRKIGLNRDLKAAYREWNERQGAEHERRQIQFLKNLTRCESYRGH
jgi:hypothetical protein